LMQQDLGVRDREAVGAVVPAARVCAAAADAAGA